MTVVRHDYELTLTLISPFSIPGSATATLGLDIALARNATDAVMIPGSLLKGVLRHLCRELAQAAPTALVDGVPLGDLVRTLFGPEFGNPSALDEDRGVLFFGDLAAQTREAEQQGKFVRVSIEPEMEAAREGHLQFIECPWPVGTPVVFKGKVTLASADAGDASRTHDLLDRALSRLIALGGAKSVGFGQVKDPKISAAAPVAAVPVTSPVKAVQVSYYIDRPFLVDALREGGNLSEGSSVIPGAAIKAVVAKALKEAGWADDVLLKQTTFRQAVPNGLLDVLPQSLYIHDKKLFCALGRERLPHDVAFQLDWKDRDTVRSTLGIKSVDPSKRGMTRTAIDPDSQTVRYEEEDGGALFSQIAVDPSKCAWLGGIVFPSDEDFRSRVMAVLQAGCCGLGKTKATISATPGDKLPVCDLGSGGPWAITLLSPAVITSQDARGEARAAYEAYFDAKGVTLIDFFAQQGLKGGYLALRYRRGDRGYAPWVITEPGAVFLVDAAPGSEGEAYLSNALLLGLEPHPGLSADWRDMPFQRENGFGQIRLNHVPHDRLKKGMPLK